MKKIKKKRHQSHATMSDNELVELARSKDPGVYRELFSRYQKRLILYVRHLVGSIEEAEDIVQNVFVKAYEHLSTYDTTKKFSSWMYRIAHNEAVNYIKKRSRRRTVSWEDIATSKDKLETADARKSPQEVWEAREIEVAVNRAMKQLPKQYAKVIRLRYYRDKSYQEIGVLLHKPQNTVGTLLHRARKHLLRIIEAMEVVVIVK